MQFPARFTPAEEADAMARGCLRTEAITNRLKKRSVVIDKRSIEALAGIQLQAVWDWYKKQFRAFRSEMRSRVTP